MKCLAEAEMEDYISPPPYLENHPSNDLLITRLKSRIDTDLYRINSVYDMEITESENKKALVILQLKEEHSSILSNGVGCLVGLLCFYLIYIKKSSQ